MNISPNSSPPRFGTRFAIESTLKEPRPIEIANRIANSINEDGAWAGITAKVQMEGETPVVITNTDTPPGKIHPIEGCALFNALYAQGLLGLMKQNTQPTADDTRILTFNADA